MTDEDEYWDQDDEEFMDGSVMTMKEHYASMGMDFREWDKDYYCLRRESNSSFSAANSRPAVYVKRATLNFPLRIEALRWKAYLNYAAHMDRKEAVSEEVKRSPDEECFIPQDPDELQQSVEEAEARGEPFSDEDIEKYSRPRRVFVRTYVGEDPYVTYDDDFWDYKEPNYDKLVAMEVIAAAAHLGEWELVILPARMKRAEDPDKQALGRRYQHEVSRGHALEDKCYLLNQLLAASILNSDALPKGHPRVQKSVRIHMNGRLYFFKVGRGHRAADHDLWPVPSDLDEITITGPFEPAGDD